MGFCSIKEKTHFLFHDINLDINLMEVNTDSAREKDAVSLQYIRLELSAKPNSGCIKHCRPTFLALFIFVQSLI